MTDDGGRYESDTDRWLEADTEAENADPKAASHILKSIASTLEDAPEGRRYDIELVVRERSVDTDTEAESNE